MSNKQSEIQKVLAKKELVEKPSELRFGAGAPTSRSIRRKNLYYKAFMATVESRKALSAAARPQIVKA